MDRRTRSKWRLQRSLANGSCRRCTRRAFEIHVPSTCAGRLSQRKRFYRRLSHRPTVGNGNRRCRDRVRPVVRLQLSQALPRIHGRRYAGGHEPKSRHRCRAVRYMRRESMDAVSLGSVRRSFQWQNADDNRVGQINADHRANARGRLRFIGWLSVRYGESPKRLDKQNVKLKSSD